MNELGIGKPSRTDWDRVDAMADDEIDYSDDPATTDEELARAELRMPKGSSSVTLQLDPDVLAWFQAQGGSYQRRMSSVLRGYVEEHRR